MEETPEQRLLRLKNYIPVEWMKMHKIRTSAGLPFEFHNHYFMVDFINDMSQYQVFLKPPQIGATESQIVKTLHSSKMQGWDIIYTLPTQADVHDMAGGKINRIVAQNPVLGSWVKDHDTVEQKKVGKNIIYYRGTFSNKQAMMVSSDLNVHDEVDASDASVILQYETRLQAKSSGRRWYFSHPSVAGFGVDIHWQNSDKKQWYITCEHCKKEQLLQWPDNIDPLNRCYICSICKEPISDDTRRYGRWINKDGVPWTGKIVGPYQFSGWHQSQLGCAWITADKILSDKEHKDEQYFWNYVLGLPYVGSENKISAGQILKNVTTKVNEQKGTIVIGVDTGLPIHYTVANKDGVFYYGKCQAPSANYDPYSELESLLLRWKDSIIVSDQGGDLIGIRRLQARYPGRVFLCYYRKDRRAQTLIRWGENEEYGTVVVDRNRMIQLSVEQFRDVGRIRLNGNVEDWKEFADHWNNIYRELVVAKETPGKDSSNLYNAEYVWKRNGPDHFVHSFIYAMTGLDRYSDQEAKVVGNDMFEGIPQGRTFNME